MSNEDTVEISEYLLRYMLEEVERDVRDGWYEGDEWREAAKRVRDTHRELGNDDAANYIDEMIQDYDENQ